MMNKILIYPAGCTPASHAAIKSLAQRGIGIADHITPETTHLLMDVPSFREDGRLKSGGDLSDLLAHLPNGITLIGGNLPADLFPGYPKMDLLKDETYQYENAALTAECALRIVGEKVSFSLRNAPVLVIGWGRIGKHLARLLSAYGAEVSVLSRTPAHLAEAASFGISGISREQLMGKAGNYRIFFNTSPGVMISKEIAEKFDNCLKIDLASRPGIEADDVIPARGLPGIHVPESSGALIAKTILRILEGGAR